ncbi:MAG: hypothetical protein LBC99_00515 [Spirochaetota bacterium]|nr:hypothetical protein [Spirochaetota bacterium]
MQIAPSAMSPAATQPYASQYAAPASPAAEPQPETVSEPAPGQNAYGGELDVRA